MSVRKISKEFIKEFTDGKFKPILDAVKDKDNKLSLEIRENAVDIYYRGGKLLEIKECGRKKSEDDKCCYSYSFDKNYCNRLSGCYSNFACKLQKTIEDWQDEDYAKNLKSLMCEMDGWFDENPRREREYQHCVSLQNENVIDIDYEIGGDHLKINMIMVDDGELYLIENKWGSSTISSRSMIRECRPGIRKHYKDFVRLLTDDEACRDLIDSMNEIVCAKSELGLLKLPGLELCEKPFDASTKINIVFVLAELNLASGNKLIANEQAGIKADFTEEITNKYPPKALIVKGDDYKIDLKKCCDFMKL